MASLRKKPDVAVDPGAETTTPAEPATQNPAERALLAQLDALKRSEGYQAQQEAIQSAQARRQEWLDANPAARQHIHALDAFHHDALQAGLVDCTPAYFDFMDERLANLPAQQPAPAIQEMQMRAAQARTPEPPPPAPLSNGSIVSAPVSREVAGSNGRRQSGKMTLTRAEVEAAAVAGITVEEYARQKQKLAGMRASGEYGGDERR